MPVSVRQSKLWPEAPMAEAQLLQVCWLQLLGTGRSFLQLLGTPNRPSPRPQWDRAHIAVHWRPQRPELSNQKTKDQRCAHETLPMVARGTFAIWNEKQLNQEQFRNTTFGGGNEMANARNKWMTMPRAALPETALRFSGRCIGGTGRSRAGLSMRITHACRSDLALPAPPLLSLSPSGASRRLRGLTRGKLRHNSRQTGAPRRDVVRGADERARLRRHPRPSAAAS